MEVGILNIKFRKRGQGMNNLIERVGAKKIFGERYVRRMDILGDYGHRIFFLIFQIWSYFWDNIKYFAFSYS